MYWFVFEKGLNSKATDLRTGIEIPFVLWLTAGLVPWFYFQEALNGGTGVLVEYSYLVKKVVFQIDMLPVVKMISALFTHLFFVAFTIVLFICMGYMPDWYALQVVYYSFCMILFATGLVYATSAVTVFFRDMKEVVGILLQIGMWVTPIMWNFETMVQIPGWAIAVLKLNPMYYIVSGIPERTDQSHRILGGYGNYRIFLGCDGSDTVSRNNRVQEAATAFRGCIIERNL